MRKFVFNVAIFSETESGARRFHRAETLVVYSTRSRMGAFLNATTTTGDDVYREMNAVEPTVVIVTEDKHFFQHLK